MTIQPHTITLPLLAFNDVYRVQQRYNHPTPSSINSDTPNVDERPEQATISVAQFARTLLDIRDGWKIREKRQYSGKVEEVKNRNEEEEQEREGLVLFAGDVFNPSVESSVTRGSHMVPILNALKLDVACVGNHDFDFGYAHLTTLIDSCKFPWLLSNIVDTRTGEQPEAMERFCIFERCGVKIGVVGLVEEDWIATIPSWPETFQHRPMKETALELSKELRDPNGPHRVDIIIALTHSRLPNDVALANELGAVKEEDVKNEHGVDLLIGGHDHIYYIGKGADSWEGFARQGDERDAKMDKGVRLIKSGTDFRDLTEAWLELERQVEGSVRRMTVKTLRGKHHEIVPSTPTSPEIEDLVESLLSTVSSTLTRPVCFTLTPFDVRSEKVRTEESAVGNWVADILFQAYAEMLEVKKVMFEKDKDGDGVPDLPEDRRRADCALICGGTLRGDSQYGPGKITLGDILEILPFDDPVVCLEIDGEGIWNAIESALSKWPAQEGRFPILAGLKVVWDHTRPPNQRVISIHLTSQLESTPNDSDADDEIDSPGDPVNFIEQEDGTRIEVMKKPLVQREEVLRQKGGRIYRMITRNYMAEGYDGFEDLKNRKFIVDDDNGQIASSILRSFLLGSSYIFRHKQLREEHTKHLSSRTDQTLKRARDRYTRDTLSPTNSPTLERTLRGLGSFSTAESSCSPTQEGILGSSHGRHVIKHSEHEIRDALRTARMEHMSEIDTLDGRTLRANEPGKCHLTDNPPRATYIVNNGNRDEIRSMDLDIAIVSPLIDGRLQDVSADKR